MIKPAALYKTEIEQKMKEYFYSDDMLFETGSLGNWMPGISDEPDESHMQLASVDENGKLLGIIFYKIDWYVSCASQFGIISFDRGNIKFARDLYNVIETIIKVYKLHRIEWRMVGGNPVEDAYDRFCEQYGGSKHILKDAIKDRTGKYYDDIIYEIILDN